jgi:acyl carrier protein
MDSREVVRGFLVRHCSGELQDDDDIFALGLVNSLFAMQLVLFVEQEFDVLVEGEDLERDNFRSVEAITALVERLVERRVA